MRAKSLCTLRLNGFHQSRKHAFEEMQNSYWGEESTSDAIFSVYLKKVRYVPPQNKDTVSRADEHTTDDSEQLQWETVKDRRIKFGTLEKIFDVLLCPSGELDGRHFNVLFTTYRVIITPYEVFKLLESLYETTRQNLRADNNNVDSDRTCLLKRLDSIRSIFTCWFDIHSEDFDTPPDFAVLHQILNFAKKHSNHLGDLHKKANAVLDRWKGLATENMPGSILLIDKACLTRNFQLQQESKVKVDLSQIDPKHISQQLTAWDADLFRCILPHQCQAKIISKAREQKYAAYSVQASIEHFNEVVNRVTTSIISQSDIKPSARAKIVTKWIHIARELRIMRNFSSLKAVLAGLQCEPVHRLKLTWAYVSGEDCAELESLARTFSDESGIDEGARKVLEQEGTAKSSEVNGVTPRKTSSAPRMHQRSRSDVGSGPGGTVPFLGSFLTDLNRIDEMLPYTNQKGWYNVEKLRKEFEVLARLKLYQHAAKGYSKSITKDPKFIVWFKKLPCLNQTECFNRSIKIEALLPPNTPDMRAQPRHFRKSSTLSNIFKTLLFDEDHNLSDTDKWLAIVPEHNRGPSSARKPSSPLPRSITFKFKRVKKVPPLIRTNTCPNGVLSTPNSPVKHTMMSGHSPFYSNSSSFNSSLFSTPPRNHRFEDFENYDGAIDEPDSLDSRPQIKKSLSAHGNSGNSLKYTSTSIDNLSKTWVGPSCYTQNNVHQEAKSYVLKVALDLDSHSNKNTPAGPTYKSIRLENGDTMNELINKALQKHLIDENASEFCLIQIVEEENRTFLLPDKCKPFYAVVKSEVNSSGFPLQFVLRRKNQPHNSGFILSLFAKKKKKKRTNLLRWSSGFL